MKKIITLITLLINVLCVLHAQFKVTTDLVFNDFVYDLIGQSVRIKLYTGNNKNVVIPETIQGVKVESFATNAFKNNEAIESIVIPYYVNVLPYGAFSDYSQLKFIYLTNFPTFYQKTARETFEGTLPDNPEIFILRYPRNGIKEGNKENVNDIEYKVYEYTGFAKTQYDFWSTTIYFCEIDGVTYGPFSRFRYNIAPLSTLERIDVLSNGQKVLIGVRGGFHVFGFNGNTYNSESSKYFITDSGDFIYIKRLDTSNTNNIGVQIFKNNEPISDIYSKIEILKIVDNDIYYSGSKNNVWNICKNDTILVSDNNEFKSVKILSNTNVYYYQGSTVSKNGRILYRANNGSINELIVSNDEKSVAYTVITNGKEEMSLYVNGTLQFTSWVIIKLSYSPDSQKLYYVETKNPRQFGNKSNFIHGPGIPPIIAGPYWNVFGFSYSNNSKYVAIQVEKSGAGYYILINSNIYGPYSDIGEDAYFTDDSSSYIYRYRSFGSNDFVQETIRLR